MNTSTKADLIRQNRQLELTKFYQRNHFEQKKGSGWHKELCKYLFLACEHRVNPITDVITAEPVRYLQYTSFGLTVEPKSQLRGFEIK